MDSVKGPAFRIGEVLREKRDGCTVEVVDVLTVYRVKFLTGWHRQGNPIETGVDYQQNIYPDELEALNGRP